MPDLRRIALRWPRKHAYRIQRFNPYLVMTRNQKLALWLGIIAVLMGVFSLYTQPDFLVTLATQVWACF